MKREHKRIARPEEKEKRRMETGTEPAEFVAVS